MNKVILLPVTGQSTCQPDAAETTAPARSSRLAALDWQSTTLPIHYYSGTGAASAHSSRLSSFAVLPIKT